MVNVSKYTRILRERRKPMFFFWRGRWTLWVETHEENLICCMSDSEGLDTHRFTGWMRKMSVSRSGKISTYLRLCPPKLHRETNITNLFLWSLNKQWMCSTLFSKMFAQPNKCPRRRGHSSQLCRNGLRRVFHRPPPISLLFIWGHLPLFPWWRIASVPWFGVVLSLG